MEIAKILVKQTTGHCMVRERIPARLVNGTVSVKYEDPIWDRLVKTVVFRGTTVKAADKFDGKTAVIPWEVLEHPGPYLYFGIWGSDPDSALQLPLIEVRIGPIEDATDPTADPGTDPTLPIWAQLKEEIAEMAAGLVEVPDSGGNVDQGSGLTSAVKTALLDAFAHVAWTDENGQSYYDALAAALSEGVVPVTGISLSKSAENIYTGYDTIVTATVLPTNATDKSIIWTSSNETVATIEGSGNTVTIKGIADGSSVITATTVDGGYIDTFTVTVAMAIPTKVTIKPTTATVKEGSTQTITATVEPVEAEDKALTWSASPANIVTLAPSADTLSCVVTGVAEGTATITATTNTGGKKATATVDVSAGEVVYIADVATVVKESAQVKVGQAANGSWGTDGAILYAVGYANDKVLMITGVKTGDVITMAGGGNSDTMFADVSTEPTGVSVADMFKSEFMDNYSWRKVTLTVTRDIDKLYITYSEASDNDSKTRAIWKKA